MKPAKDTIDNLEKILFEVICIIIIVVMVQSMTQYLINNGPGWINIAHAVISISCGVFFYLSRFRGYFNSLRIPLILLANAGLVFFWFRVTGYNGATGIGAAIVGTISVIILPRKGRRAGLVLIVGLFILLVYLHKNTDWVRYSASESSAVSYVVILLGLMVMINYLKTEFDKERRMVGLQNEKLKSLNQNLQQAIRDNQETIKTLQATQTRLIDSEKMASVGRLTAGLAHELNNPLNFIGGNVRPIINDLQEIKESMDVETIRKNDHIFKEIEQLLSNVYDGSKRVTDVINNLLKISPRGSGTENQAIRLNDLLDRTRLLLQNAHPKIEISLQADEPIYVHGNAIEINQVLLNILKNAIDAVHPKRGKIHVNLYTRDQLCCVDISDNGIGVPEEYQSQIFEPFFTTKEEGKGTGLGLYISYGIIKKHNGDLTYKRLTKGSRFRITLPIYSNHSPHRKQSTDKSA